MNEHEKLEQALNQDTEDYYVDYWEEPGIAANAFRRGWEAAMNSKRGSEPAYEYGVSKPHYETPPRAVSDDEKYLRHYPERNGWVHYRRERTGDWERL